MWSGQLDTRVSSITLAAGWSCPGCIVSLSCAVKKFPVAILYGVVICNFDEDLKAGYYVEHTNLNMHVSINNI